MLSVKGEVRKESFGGLYYERDRLAIELLNDTAYEILNLIQQGMDEEGIEQIIIKEYSAEPEAIKRDLREYFSYLSHSGYVIENKKEYRTEALKQQNSEPETDQNNSMKNNILGMPPYVLISPLKVLLELTYNCNLKCVHCFADAEYCKKTEKGYLDGELSTNEWFKVIDNIIDAGVFEILLSGGEATMRKDLFEIAEHIQGRGRTYCLLSNTTLIDDDFAIRLKKTGCAKVESNLDGYDSATYDAFRGVAGSFDLTVKGIRACLKQGIPVRCNVMETKVNIFDLKKIVDKAYEIGVREVCVVPLENGGRAKKNDKLRFSKEEQETLDSFYKEVNNWFAEKYSNTDMVLLTPYLLKRGSESRISKVLDLNDFMPACGAGTIHCTIDPYGDMKLCPTDTNVLKGERNNVINNDLRKIWKESKILQWVRSNEFKSCHHCETRCEYACPILQRNEANNKKCHRNIERTA